MKKNVLIKNFVLAYLVFFHMTYASFAMENPTFSKQNLSRGKATEMIVNHFQLEEKNKDFLNQCKKDYSTCAFAFGARTRFKKMSLDPLILYPDVYPAYRYYNAVNIASLLDLASGYYLEEQSPFKPEQPITRVEALKLVLGASGLLTWKEKFEFSDNEKIALNKNSETGKWWYWRYLSEAINRGFITKLSPEYAEELIDEDELIRIMKSANRFIVVEKKNSEKETYALDKKHFQNSILKEKMEGEVRTFEKNTNAHTGVKTISEN